MAYPDRSVLNNLKAHGIRIEKLTEDVEIEVLRFKINELKGANSPNQGHYNTNIKGEYIAEKNHFAAGTIIIKTGQPLGNLAAYLLEPEADDGLLSWNFFDKYIVPQWGRNYFPYPAFKVMKKTKLPLIELK